MGTDMTAEQTVIWVDVELLGEHDTHDIDVVCRVFAAAVADGGGAIVDVGDLPTSRLPPGDSRPVLVASFEDPAAAAEVAVLGQWAVQRCDPHPGVKVRVGLHAAGELASAAKGAAALCEAANGNQILFSGPVDVATGGMLDARPMGMATLPGETAATQLWLMTDSRPDVDRRPLRLGQLGIPE